jgi:hypothetical protein
MKNPFVVTLIFMTLFSFLIFESSFAGALGYSTYLGGGGDDRGYGIAIDGSGNTYITGGTSSSDFPTTSGAFDTSYNGGDVFVTKVDSTGTALVYSTYLGSGGDDRGYGIALDSSGNVYITGLTYSSDFPTTPGAFDTSYNGVYCDVFVSKLNASGTALVYSTYLGGGSSDVGSDIAIDSSGNTYITGYTYSDFPTTPGAFDTSYNGPEDVFVSKLNASGTVLVYSTYLGAWDRDYGYGIAVDSSGNAYITGFTWSSNFPTTPGAFDISLDGLSNVFVTKLNASGTALVYSTYLGGGDDEGHDIAIDGLGNAYITGYTRGGLGRFPTTPGAFDTSYNGSGDVFVTKLNASGTALVYSTYLGGGDYDEGWGIAIDVSGNAYVSGDTFSSDFTTTPDALDTTYNGDTDVFVTKLNASGTALVYSTYLGGGSDDWGRGITIDGLGNAYITGWIGSSNFPTTAGALDTSYNGGSYDVFVTKFSADYIPIELIDFQAIIENQEEVWKKEWLRYEE